MSGSSIRRISFIDPASNASSRQSDEEKSLGGDRSEAISDNQAAVVDHGLSGSNHSLRPDCLMIDNIPVPPSLDPRAMPDFVGFPRHSARSSIFGRTVLIIAFALAVIAIVEPRLPPVSIIVKRPLGEEPTLSLPQSPVRNPVAVDPTEPKRQRLSLVKQPQALPSDQHWPMRALLSMPDDGVFLVISGLSPGTKVSAGRQASSNSWQMSASDLRDAVIIPPQGFVGTMDVTVELHQADGVVADQRPIRLEWTPSAADVPESLRLEADEIARLMKQGQQLLANGQIAPARLIFQRVAEAGEASAALALAETFDGTVLARVGAKGVDPDPASARTWYERAARLGATEARRRLDALGQPVK